MEMETPQKKSSSGFGPGPALAKAREGLGLTHEEVAERLRLAPRQVQALESDDYDHLPGPTYIRGYLRSYAELVGLASGPILEAYGHVPAASKTTSLDSIAPREDVTSQHRHVRLATYALVALIIALAASWWQGRSHRETPVPARVPAPLAAAPAVAVPAVRPAAVPPKPGSAPARVSARPTAASVRTGAAVSSPSGSQTAAAKSPQAAVPGNVAAATAASGRVLLVLKMVQDSWVDVHDAQGNKLLYETVPAGRVVTLEGSAPLSVFLGNAAGVQVEFDGKPFNPAPYIHGQVARFILGAARRH